MRIKPKLPPKTAAKITPVNASELFENCTIGQLRANLLFLLNNEEPQNILTAADNPKDKTKITSEYAEYLKWRKDNMSHDELAALDEFKQHILKQF